MLIKKINKTSLDPAQGSASHTSPTFIPWLSKAWNHPASPLSAHRNCSRSWSSWRCRRSISRMSKRTWKRNSSMPRRRWNESRASHWLLGSFWRLWIRIQPSWAPPQVHGGGGVGVVYPSVHSTAVNYFLPCARNLQWQTREDSVFSV